MNAVCSKCGIEKPLTEFHKRNTAGAKGHRSDCKECVGAAGRERYQRNRDKYIAKSIKWQEDNPDLLRAKNVREYWRNRERNIARRKLWGIENPEMQRELVNRRRVRMSGSGHFLILEKEIKRLYQSPCQACGSTEQIEQDHIVPLSRGGRHCIGNLQPLCSPCNKSKGSKFMFEWKLSRL